MAEDIATLAMQIDSSSAKTARADLDQLTATGKRTEDQTKRVGQAASDAGRQLDSAASGASKFRAAQEDVAAAGTQVVQSMGQQRQGMLVLGEQLRQVGTEFALGIKPSQIFAQQIGQVTYAVQLMAGGTSKLASFLGGPWGIAVSVGVSVLAPLVAKLFDVADAADDAGSALKSAVEQFYKSINQVTPLQNVLNEATKQQVTALGDIARLNRDIVTAQGALTTAARGSDQAYAIAAKHVGDLQQQLAAAKKSAQDAADSATAAIDDAKIHAAAQDRISAAYDKTAGSAPRATAAVRDHTKALSAAALAAQQAAKEEAEYQKLLESLGISDAQLERKSDIQKAFDDLNATLPKTGELSDKAGAALKTLQDDADRAAAVLEHKLNAELRNTIDALQQIGGLGGAIGGILGGVLSGNFRDLGPIGALLNVALSPKDDLAKQVGLLSSHLQDIFGVGGSLADTLAKGLQNAGLGTLAGAAVLGSNQSATQQVGSALGGIAGGIAGNAFKGAVTSLATSAFGATIGSALGSAVPVIGTILGGIAGSLVGKLFSGGAKYGNASSTGGITGNNSDAQSAASQLGDSVKSGLESIASQLGLTLGTYQTSIGVTDGKYRYSTTGRTGELKSGYSDVTVTGTGDAGAAAAVAGAIKDAIKDGALQGLSETEKAFLLKAGDLNSALNEVLDFHTTLDAITGASNAFVTSLTTLKAQFATAEKAFQDLGATAEQTSQLQQYEQQQLNALVQQASSQYLSTFGTSAQQTAAAQKQISDTLTPLGYGDVTTVAQYTSLVNATDALKDPDLYGALLGLVDAFSTLKDAADQATQATAAQAAADAAAKAQALSGAQNDLAQAYQRESSALKDTISAADGAITTLTTFRDTLIGAGQAGANVNQLLAKVIAVGSLAASGDVTAAGQLPDAAQNYLAAAKASAHSYTEYQRAVATVLGYTDRAINGADAAKDTAQKQLDAMTQQVGLLIDLNQTALTVKDAIDRLNALLSPHSAAGGGDAAHGNQQRQQQDRQDRHQRTLEDRMARLEQNTAGTNEAMTQMLRHWKNLSPDGVSINVRGDPDAPVYTDTAP